MAALIDNSNVVGVKQQSDACRCTANKFPFAINQRDGIVLLAQLYLEIVRKAGVQKAVELDNRHTVTVVPKLRSQHSYHQRIVVSVPVAKNTHPPDLPRLTRKITVRNIAPLGRKEQRAVPANPHLREIPVEKEERERKLVYYCLFSVLILAVRPVCLRFCVSLWSHYKKQLL